MSGKRFGHVRTRDNAVVPGCIQSVQEKEKEKKMANAQRSHATQIETG